jgi:uncharacterized membrane protein SpoIIM required for sporulation
MIGFNAVSLRLYAYFVFILFGLPLLFWGFFNGVVLLEAKKRALTSRI